MTTAVDVAKAALCEAGRPDLAQRVEMSRHGYPKIRRHDAQQVEGVVLRAFLLGHLAEGHDDHLCPDSYGRMSIHCSECDTGPCEGPAVRS